MISRRELTSQGAKSRRMLIEALLARPDEERFGIPGYGPDRAMYEAVFRVTGMHAKGPERMEALQAVPQGARVVQGLAGAGDSL